MENLSRRAFLKIGLTGLVAGGCQTIPFEEQMIKRGSNLTAPRNYNLEKVAQDDELLII